MIRVKAGVAVLVGLVVGWAAAARWGAGPDLSAVAPHLDAAAARFGVEPTLVRAVAAVESGGDPAARSAVGAIGLMQLMPATAAEVAASLGDEGTPDLTDPATNARLGVAYLARLLDRFDRQVELALAAYNAGGTRVKEWVERCPNLAPAEVVERMGSTETRLYVRRVLRYQSRSR